VTVSASLVARCTDAPVQSSTERFVAGVSERQRASSRGKLTARSGLRPPATPARSSFRFAKPGKQRKEEHRHRAVQQAAAPDRGPFAGPALKRLARCRLRRLRSRHAEARGRVSGRALGRRINNLASGTLSMKLRLVGRFGR